MHVDWVQEVTSRPLESWLCVLTVLICMWVCGWANFGATSAHFPLKNNCNCCLSFTSDQTDQRVMMITYFCLLVSVLIGKNYAGELISHCFSTVSCWVEHWESHFILWWIHCRYFKSCILFYNSCTFSSVSLLFLCIFVLFFKSSSKELYFLMCSGYGSF